MAPTFRGGCVNPPVEDGCHDPRYRVQSFPAQIIEDFKSTSDDAHMDITEQHFAQLFATKAERINLSMLGLEDRHIIDIASILAGPAAKYCRSLYLHNNKMSAKGAEALVDAVVQNSSLTELYLHYNKLGDDGAQHIGRLLQKNRRLLKLDVGANGMSAAGLHHVVDGLQDNGSLDYIGFFGNAPETVPLLPSLTNRLKPEARVQRRIGIQVKNKFLEHVQDREAWEKLSDEISVFFSNTMGDGDRVSAKAMLHVPRVDKGQNIELTGVDGKKLKLSGPVPLHLIKGNMARDAELEVSYSDPESGRSVTARIDGKHKEAVCKKPTSIVSFLDPMQMFPSKPRFRGEGLTDEAGAQYVCCAGPKKAFAKCPYRATYHAKEPPHKYVLRRDRETGRFFVQTYWECLPIDEVGESGEGMPKHIVRAETVETVYVDSVSGTQLDCVDDQGVRFSMKLSKAHVDGIVDGGVNAMLIRGAPPHPHYVPWRVAHVHEKVEDVAERWAQKAFKAKKGGALVDTDALAEKLVAVHALLSDDKAAEKSNVRFVCEKCYDSYI